MSVHIRPLSREEVRDLDVRAAQELALPTVILMENAGRGAAGWFAELAGIMKASAGGRIFDGRNSGPDTVPPVRASPVRVLIVCGPGNNGGDGGVMARHLDAWGVSVRLIWFGRKQELRGDAATQWSILEKAGIDQLAWFDEAAYETEQEPEPRKWAGMFAETDWVVDALFGTGLTRPVEGVFRALIEAMNASGKPIFSLDIPSGLDADSGQPLGIAVRASATATFVGPKRGFGAPGASGYTGEVAVIDIGVPRSLLEPFLVE